MSRRSIKDFINTLDNKIYNRIRKSMGNAECRRLLLEHEEKFNSNEPQPEFFRDEFPKTMTDFIGLARPFNEGEINRADKEGLIMLCEALKRKELGTQIKLNNALNRLDELESIKINL